MKKHLLVIGFALFLSLVFVLPSKNVSADIVDDTGAGAYWGGNPPGTMEKDVIGSFDFQIENAEVTFVKGTSLSIKINTGFITSGIGTYGAGDTYNLTDQTKNASIPDDADGKGMGIGDLFLAEVWNPAGNDPHHILDSHSTGTEWEKAIKFDTFSDHWNADLSGGGHRDASLVDLSKGFKDNNNNAYISSELLSGGIYRHDQEVMVTQDTNEWEVVKSAGVDINLTNATKPDFGMIEFTIDDLAGTGMETWNTLAFHFTMSCANDVIEGSVPEPSLELLFGISLVGLVGVGAVRRIKQKTVVNS
ncbi:carbamate kinase [Candidatus Scalindua japonica]|uniref:Carbamate kinase n=1 Tax=Candidatus Scalindua japonica TaxID=1284222 RepID=A0A286TXQ6_9BACT|nr:hypothetical protein [Candidatus Scalindua japonica]GAX60657.1 carbamate kinase [Candidatus Scalindua japonica]